MKRLIVSTLIVTTVLAGTQTTTHAQTTQKKKMTIQFKKAIKIIKQKKRPVATKDPMQIAEDVSKKYYIQKNGPVYTELRFKFDHYEGENIGVVWVYESHPEHLATINWCTIDLKTKKVIKVMYEW